MQVISRGGVVYPRARFEFGSVVHFHKALEDRVGEFPVGFSCVGYRGAGKSRLLKVDDWILKLSDNSCASVGSAWLYLSQDGDPKSHLCL